MLKEPTKKEIDAYFKRVEDPTNYSSGRWWHLINSWHDHIFRIMVEKKWVDDGSAYYEQLINTLRQVYEAPLHDFVAYWIRESPIETPDSEEIEYIVKNWKPCNKEIAMLMFEEGMDDFDIIWKKKEDKIINHFHVNAGEWMGASLTTFGSWNVEGDCIFDIKHPDNWKRLEIAFKESNIAQMKYKYDGKKSDWIDISKDIMRKGLQNPVPLSHVNIMWAFCKKPTYYPDDDKYDLVYRANILLRKWFLPNAKKEQGYNPIYTMGKFKKRGIETSKYKSHIRFSYHP